MSNDSRRPPHSSPDAYPRAILAWLARAHGRTGGDDADELHAQLRLLRGAPIPLDQRIKLLDLLYKHTERIVCAELPTLYEITLPVSRRVRQRSRIVQELLETLVQEYLNSLSALFDPQHEVKLLAPAQILAQAMHGIGWHIRFSQLIAAPNGMGIWQQLHATYRTARRLGLAETPGPGDEPSVQQAYIRILLAAIAQPASFSSRELAFIVDYIASSVRPVDILESPPQDRGGVFWMDLDQDFPAYALNRRAPPVDVLALYFTCDLVARDTREHLAALSSGTPAASLGLPDFADTPAGRGVLQRLGQCWGRPAARKFPRRRQSYRVNLCAGLEQLWQLIRHPESEGEISEWMVTNESPDGYSLMHMSGSTSRLRVGDIVAVQPTGERAEHAANWHVGIVRWAISENPEHIELGMQQLASHAIAAEVIRPQELESGNLSALILPEMPPLRTSAALVARTGQLNERDRRLILLIENDHVGIREVRPTAVTEQTSSIEIFSVAPDESL
jgi:cyclic-di-GMP-binding protein